MGTHTHISSYANIINVITQAWVLISGGQRGHANLPTYLEGGGGWMEQYIKCPPLFRWPIQKFYQICMTTLTPEEWATVDLQPQNHHRA